jgi:hypothetical protein
MLPYLLGKLKNTPKATAPPTVADSHRWATRTSTTTAFPSDVRRRQPTGSVHNKPMAPDGERDVHGLQALGRTDLQSFGDSTRA